jgi:hypothetical protein
MKDPARCTVRAGSGCVLRYRTKQGACPAAGYPFAEMAGEDWPCVPFCQAVAPAAIAARA